MSGAYHMLNDNDIAIQIIFDTMDTEIHKEILTFDLPTFIGTAGGSFGLFLGFSLTGFADQVVNLFIRNWFAFPHWRKMNLSKSFNFTFIVLTFMFKRMGFQKMFKSWGNWMFADCPVGLNKSVHLCVNVMYYMSSLFPIIFVLANIEWWIIIQYLMIISSSKCWKMAFILDLIKKFFLQKQKHKCN